MKWVPTDSVTLDRIKAAGLGGEQPATVRSLTELFPVSVLQLRNVSLEKSSD